MFLILIALFLLFVVWLFIIDYLRKVPDGKNIPLTFIIPCYNDQDTVWSSIDSIYSSYPHDKITLIVINDTSTDASYDIILQKQREYKCTVINHTINLGKVVSINEAIDIVKTDYFLVLDADTQLSSKAMLDMLWRIQNNHNVAAVSCYYRPANKWFLALMQGIEYHMMALIQWAYNIRSTVSLWWWCMLLNTQACRKVWKYSINAIVEDMDMAFRMNAHGYRVEQSYVSVATHVPDTIRSWFKQKIRWNSWAIQCFLTYAKVWIKNPIHVIFTLLTNGLFLFISLNIYKQLLTIEAFATFFFGLIDVMTFRQSIITVLSIYTERIRSIVWTKIWYTLFSLPYVFPYFFQRQTRRKVLLIFPFAWIYVPMFSLIWLVGFSRWIYRTIHLGPGQRGR